MSVRASKNCEGYEYYGDCGVSHEQDFGQVEMDAGGGRHRFDAAVFLCVGEGDRDDIGE